VGSDRMPCSFSRRMPTSLTIICARARARWGLGKTLQAESCEQKHPRGRQGERQWALDQGARSALGCQTCPSLREGPGAPALISERGPGSASRCGTCRQERKKREEARQGWVIHHLIRDPTALPYVEILGLWVGRRARAAQCPLGAWNPELHDPSAPAHHACVAESGQKDRLCLFIWLGCMRLCKEEAFQFAFINSSC
jgi:hypothetical protein